MRLSWSHQRGGVFAWGSVQQQLLLLLLLGPLRCRGQPQPTNPPNPQVAFPPTPSSFSVPFPTSAPIGGSSPAIATPTVVQGPTNTNSPMGVVTVTAATTSTPIVAPVSPPTNVPIGTTTTTTTNSPTVAPVTASPTMATTTTAAPTTFAPTRLPLTAMPVSTPITQTPSFLPTTLPTMLPTVNSTTPSPSTIPSALPATTTTNAPTMVTNIPHGTTVQYLTIRYDGVPQLDFSTEEIYSEAFSGWFDGYFVQNRRRLQQQYGISNMESYVDFSDQLVTATSNTITYTQSLAYQTSSVNVPLPTEIAKLPFRDGTYRQSLVPILQNRIPQFKNWNGIVMIPEIVLPRGPDNPVKEETFFTPAVIAGIAGGGILFMGILFWMCFCCCKANQKKKKRNKYSKPIEQPPPDQFQFSNDESQDGISVMEEPSLLTKKTRLSADGSTLGYGDQSVATVDYDYSKAYGGGGAASVVSSVGGTLGDTTKLTTENMLSQRAALGANVGSDVKPVGVHEEVIVIVAPPGKLGVVIDTPDDGAPLVHAVKDSSVIANKICVGDKLVAVDDDDVRSMTAIKVSKLISKRSNNPTRRLTVVRTIHSGHP